MKWSGPDVGLQTRQSYGKRDQGGKTPIYLLDINHMQSNNESFGLHSRRSHWKGSGCMFDVDIYIYCIMGFRIGIRNDVWLACASVS
jgi:hypothetical protein